MDYKRALGVDPEKGEVLKSGRKRLIQYINLKLAALGLPVFGQGKDIGFLEIAQDLISNHLEKNRLLSSYLCPADKRIQKFLEKYLSDIPNKPEIKFPTNTFILDRHGIARMLSLPPDRDEFISDIVSTYKLKQGILHNPKNDKRTTKGVFHIAEGGLPVPDDKLSVPKEVFARMLFAALNPPRELLQLPYTASQDEKAELFVSLLLRPIVCPEVPGYTTSKSMEIRFFAPGNLVGNLDFVESIFGNAGDPYLPQNDAALDVEHWTGHTGCIILAPHLISLTKKELGLPKYEDATDRLKRDGMCWKEETELYNGGQAFKVTARTDEGIMVTIIADNYFGYSKKEVKTQISYSANLYGNCEEEHSGGAVAFPSYNLGDEFHDDNQVKKDDHSFEQTVGMFSDIMDVRPEGYAVDKKYSDIIYVPDDASFNLVKQTVKWSKNGEEKQIKLLPKNVYVFPAGYKVKMEKNPEVPSWRLVGTVAEGTFCHKPSTVSGGGKSEISKSISDSILYGPFFVADFEKDSQFVDEIINKDYSDRYIVRVVKETPSRPLLSNKRSLGSVIKLLTPSASEYSPEYNDWLKSIPQYVKGLVFIIKRFYKPEWGSDWQKYFSVDIVNGSPGNELKLSNRKIVAAYLRVGLEKSGAWRTYKLRQDFIASDKLQVEDDITASVVVPSEKVEFLNKEYNNKSVKFTSNCEFRLFQRPDEAIHRGYDKQAEEDIASPETFISNFAPLTREDAREIMQDSIGFELYSAPMKKLIEEMVNNKGYKYFVSSAHPRIVNGKPSANVRYLQNRQDLLVPRGKYLAETGTRFFRKIPLDKPVHVAVNAVLPGRRNNQPEPGIRPLCVYNPVHFQELPELFMDFICSLTGKSPSTTGAGSEGALTKGPFNAISPITDLNNALVSFILTEYDGFTTAAGYVGPNYRVDHDISLLIPEIWSRLTVQERNPQSLIADGYLEKLNDFEYNGQLVLASRLGYRITDKFVHIYFGRVFENPNVIFDEEMLKPELQDMSVFADGINNIVEAQMRVAKSYFEDGSVEAACPPLKALLHIMVHGSYEGMTVDDPELRKMFTRDFLLTCDWYEERLINKQLSDIALWQHNIIYLEEFLHKPNYTNEAVEMGIQEMLEKARTTLKYVKSTSYLKSLKGTIGLDGIYKLP